MNAGFAVAVLAGFCGRLRPDAGGLTLQVLGICGRLQPNLLKSQAGAPHAIAWGRRQPTTEPAQPHFAESACGFFYGRTTSTVVRASGRGATFPQTEQQK